MAGVAEEYRHWFVVCLCLLGVGLILIGVVLTINHQQQFAALEVPATQLAAPPETVEQARLLQNVLFWLAVLIGAFIVSTLAFFRWSRRFRSALLRRPRPPTPADDVWAMHRLPDASPADPSPSDSGTPDDD